MRGRTITFRFLTGRPRRSFWPPPNPKSLTIASQHADMAAKSYIVLCRHGQRAPGKKLLASDHATWLPLALPHTSPSLADLFIRYPVLSHVKNDTPHDQQRFPFGSITEYGTRYVQDVGARLGTEFPQIAAILREEHSNNLNGQVQVYATNYRRTQVR